MRLTSVSTTLCVLGLLTATSGCRPAADDPTTQIQDPEAELGPAKKKADEDRAKAGGAKPAEEKRAEPPPAKVEVAKVGEPAPDFALPDLQGNTVELKSFAGKTVVLEWFNPGCPFVQYAHGEGPLATMAKDYMAKDVIWLSINSSAPGKQGHGVEANQEAVAEWKMENPVLLDESGEVGRTYGAKTTPHIFIVAGDGTLAYAGGLDNAPRGQVEGELVNFAGASLDAMLAGGMPAAKETKPYGCSVKYAD